MLTFTLVLQAGLIMYPSAYETAAAALFMMDHMPIRR